MMTFESSRFAVALTSTLVLAAPALAQRESGDDLSGRLRVGYRGVDVTGEEGKYRQHYNLEDGPRLFEARFDYVATGSLRNVVDTISFDLDNYGGDPFETLRFDIRKFGKYSFAYERVKSTYFYDDIIFPPGFLDPSLDAEGDFTSFDVDRIRDHAAFDLTLTPRASLDFDFNRFTRRGESTTPLRIEGEVFQLERPIDETNNELGVAFQYRWDKLALAIEERVRDFENAAEVFLPGSSYATNLDNDTEVFFFVLSQPYELSSTQTTVRATLTPDPRWIVQVATSFENLDLDASASENSSGIDDEGLPFETDVVGSGGLQRDTRWFDGDVSYLVNERVSVVGSLWSNALDQEGDFTFGEAVGLNRWDISTTGVEGGIQFAAAEHVTITGGLRYESRTVDWDQSEDEPLEIRTQETSHTGLFAVLSWTPRPTFNVNAEAETGSYDDPFTLASPSSRFRARLQANYHFDNGAYLAAMYIGRRLENDDRPEGQLSSDPNWNADRDNVNARVGYRRGGMDASAGYSFVRATNSVEQTLAIDEPFLFPISFVSDANFVDGRFFWAFDPVWRAGGDLRFYDNDGSFPLKRNDLRVYAEATLANGYLVNVGYRYIDYEEKTYGFNNYDANIVEASIGYVW
ncbi:MAG: hypothetical protein ACRD1X_10890 [Vicinamibacteria bacterium]